MKHTKQQNWILYIPLILIAIFMLFPVLWVVSSSLKPSGELFSWPPSIIPQNFTLNNYISAFQESNFTRYLFNTVFVTVAATVLTLVINTMAGYALAKYRFRGSAVILVFFLSTLMIPLEALMIPMFIVLKNLGLYNTLWGIIIPPAATPTGVFLVRQYLMSVPDEMIEAAKIDGASDWKIFIRLILPLAKPILATLTIFSIMWRWQDYIWPLIAISDSNLYTLELALANFVGQYSVDWGPLLAMAVLTMVPLIIIFLIFQRFFIRGIMMTGMKD
ncbi:carbohydrate ABC transporter permease [Salibacterium qingdaonense]|uniref:Carbohydrate ABC transporter membrane protein 2, CUT1 family n=1 Tax=Salibacterium qingdaonense TaxID=266892 RepID=A0A1I4LM11_9BACI|nr:carbohydrate ABC transporter permease [Salibacterium qingdaonense]SFL91863.1 carbohydrate ABC transporter membrane protein 2, CUT1 family [Salibacterium qingdaonense]